MQASAVVQKSNWLYGVIDDQDDLTAVSNSEYPSGLVSHMESDTTDRRRHDKDDLIDHFGAEYPAIALDEMSAEDASSRAPTLGDHSCRSYFNSGSLFHPPYQVSCHCFKPWPHYH